MAKFEISYRIVQIDARGRQIGPVAAVEEFKSPKDAEPMLHELQTLWPEVRFVIRPRQKRYSNV
jgi:hypothetical protein